jgi:hypothetical protein
MGPSGRVNPSGVVVSRIGIFGSRINHSVLFQSNLMPLQVAEKDYTKKATMDAYG